MMHFMEIEALRDQKHYDLYKQEYMVNKIEPRMGFSVACIMILLLIQLCLV